MDAVVERYLALALRLGRHVDGFVDAYYGPPELAELVEGEAPAEPVALAEEARAVADAIPMDWDESRRRWLSAQLRSCETLAARLGGEELRWSELVERLYGIRPSRANEDEMSAAHRLLDEALPGPGPVQERYERWLMAQTVEPERILAAARRVCEPLRARARELAALPDDEAFELELVSDEPWSAYNYYLGGHRSRVVINTDVPVWSHVLVVLVAHELYPGHHTEGVSKEVELRGRRGWDEHSVLLVLAPQSLLAEGIATLALEQALGADAHAVAGELLQPLGVPYDADTATALRQAQELLAGARVDAAFQLHEEGRPLDEVREYLLHWTLRPRENVDQSLSFITDPTWRAYVSTYVDGYRVCRAYVGGDDERFARLLREPVLPSDLAVEAAG